jgi:plasmid segregation protein ParM
VPAEATVRVVTGVPLNRYFTSSGEVRESVLTRKVQAWLRGVRDPQGARLPEIIDVTVVAQAVAAWFDFIIGANMQVDDALMNDYMAVVDIGGRTTDVAVFEHGEADMRQSGTLDHGVLDLAAAITRQLEDRYPSMSRLPQAIVESAINSGVATLGSTTIDVSEVLEREKRALIERIAVFVASRYGSNAPLIKRVLFVGGGSVALRNQLRARFPNAVFAEDPQMANARGMLKYGYVSSGEELPQGRYDAGPEEAWVQRARSALAS